MKRNSGFLYIRWRLATMMSILLFFLISSKNHIRYQSCNWIRSHDIYQWWRHGWERSRDSLVMCTWRLKNTRFDCCQVTNFSSLYHFLNSKNAEADRDRTTEVAYLCIKTCKAKLFDQLQLNGSYRSSTRGKHFWIWWQNDLKSVLKPVKHL